MAYSKQTWDTTSYVNPTRMNHIEDGIASADLTNRGISLPDKTGTIALTSDLVKYKDNTFTGLSNSDNTKYYINLTTDFYTALGIPSNKIVIGVTVLTWSGSNKTPPVLAIDGTALAWVFPAGHTFTNAQIKVRIAYF